MEDKLKQISMADHKTRMDLYRQYLKENESNGEALKKFVAHMVADETPLTISRQLMSEFAEVLLKKDKDFFKDVAVYATDQLRPKNSSFEEAVIALRERLCDLYKDEEEYKLAAQTLSLMPLDGARGADVDFKARTYITIAQLYLEDDNSVDAETYISRAGNLMSDITNPKLILLFNVCFARSQDYKRKFYEAAVRYSQLSQMKEINDSEREYALKQAIICALLAPAGPNRTRLLTMLYKDERAASLSVYAILQKMVLERFIRNSEVENFAKELKPHHTAITSSGFTVLQYAMIEHNLVAISKIYSNITFDELGSLLSIDSAKAEKMAAKMITEDRLKGTIDQIDRAIYFVHEANNLLLWDSRIQRACSSLNRISEVITNKYPQFKPK